MTNEWQDVPNHFKGFLRSLRLPWGTREIATEVVTTAAQHLDPFYHPSSCLKPEGDPHCHFRLIGGLAKGTAILPVETVDMLYILPSDLRPPSGFDAETRQYIARELALNLKNHAGGVHLTSEGWLCIPACGEGPFASLTLRILPCLPLELGGYEVATVPVNATWRHVHPDAELESLKKANQASGNKARHLIRMLKCWQRHRKVAIPSIALEQLAIEFMELWTYQRRSVLFYDWMVRDFFFWVSHQSHRRLTLPGNVQEIEVGDIWQPDAEISHTHANAACRQERAAQEVDALKNWQALFGKAFDSIRDQSASFENECA